MNSGNRTTFIFLLACLGTFAAADAGFRGEDGTGAMWVAPELLEALEAHKLPRCMADVVIEPADFQVNGRVAFQWNPATGELSFAADGAAPAMTLPEDFSPHPRELAMQSCESR